MNQASTITPMVLEKAQDLQKAIFANMNDTSTSLSDCLQELAQTPCALKDYDELQRLNFNGQLDAFTVLRIALTLAELNQCQTSLALHTASARQAGLNSSEIDSNRAGTSQDAKGAIAVQFARHLASHSKVSAQHWQDIRRAGYSDCEVLEIISHVGMNILGNRLISMGIMNNHLFPIGLNPNSKVNKLIESKKVTVSGEQVKGPSTA